MGLIASYFNSNANCLIFYSVRRVALSTFGGNLCTNELRDSLSGVAENENRCSGRIHAESR